MNQLSYSNVNHTSDLMSAIRNSNTFKSAVAARNGWLSLNENIFNLIIISLQFRFYYLDFQTQHSSQFTQSAGKIPPLNERPIRHLAFKKSAVGSLPTVPIYLYIIENIKHDLI